MSINYITLQYFQHPIFRANLLRNQYLELSCIFFFNKSICLYMFLCLGFLYGMECRVLPNYSNLNMQNKKYILYLYLEGCRRVHELACHNKL